MLAPLCRSLARVMQSGLVCLALTMGVSGARAAGTGPASSARLLPAAVFNGADEALLDQVERASFQFFLEQSHPVTGLVHDRAHADGSPREGKASIAASGFALTAFAIGAERGWIDRAAALDRVRTHLRFLATQAPRVHGFFYHFMEYDTGARAWQCELSTIDTGLFLAGALFVREYFHDAEVTALVNQLYREIDWQWFLNNGSTFAMGWHDENGFSRFRWSAYSELMMLTLLGLGAEEHPISSELWSAWERGPAGDYGGYHYIQYPSLFVHQFTHAYVAFRGRRDAYADYYRNSLLATLAQRRFCADLRDEFPSWSERLWGITASDSATGYRGGWGGPPRTFDAIALDGTLAPCAAAGSLPFTPEESLVALQHMRAAYGDRIWQRYGFVDAFNPETGWVDQDVIGIDVGIQLLQIENARTNFVHQVFMQAPEVERALARAGFVPTERTLPLPDIERIRALARDTWAMVGATPLRAETAGLQLSAVVAARALGFMTGQAALVRAKALLATLPPPPTHPADLGEYAAALVLVRQAFPALAAQTTLLLSALDWTKVAVTATQLGTRDRLAVFFQIATHARPVAAWTALARVPLWIKPVYVLAPASLRDQVVPGLWLDERAIISGASAAQLTYAGALAAGAPAAPRPTDLLTVAAWLEHFPGLAAAALRRAPVPAVKSAALGDAAALLLAAANLISPDCIRSYWQQDPLVQAGRAAIGDFAAAEFGPNNATFWRRELAGPRAVPAARRTIAVPASTPRTQWPWVQMSGPEFKDSVADTRPGDPALSMRFAFTWDAAALYFHADVVDALPKVVAKPGERNGVELFINPRNDGFAWLGEGSYQFAYRVDGRISESFHRAATTAELHRIADGYSIDARIPWKDLGLTPHAGLEIAVSPAVVSEGRAEWEPALKLNWQYYRRADDRIQLGLLRLE